MFRYPYDGFQFPINNYQDYLYALQQRSVQNIMQIIRTDHNNLYLELEQEGLNRNIIDALFYLVVNYAVSQSNTNQLPNQMYNRFQNQIPWFGLLIRQFNLPKNRLDRILVRIIEIVLRIIKGEDGYPCPGQG